MRISTSVFKEVTHLFFLAVVAWLLAGCDRIYPENVTLSDPLLQPMLKAMEKVNRAELGFTPITTNDRITLEVGSSKTYDAMLHIYGDTLRSIAFRKTASGYRWIFEQEIHEGPGWRQSVDGTFREQIVIEYQTEPVDGVPTNQIFISYTGTNADLHNHQLNLPEARLILEKWKTSPVQPKPPDLPNYGYPDPLPAFLVLMVCLTVLIIAGLILVVAAFCGIVLLILLVAGMVSTSVFVAYFRRSFSAGFRSLLIQFGALGGMLCGALATAVIIVFRHLSWNSPLYWIMGISFGFIIGILFAWTLAFLLGRLGRALSNKLAVGN